MENKLIFREHWSELDRSVNFEHRLEDGPGMLEARYVQRTDDYFIVYLSSQTGCEQACRMCWLTQTGQNKSRDVTVDEYLQQAERVMEHYGRRLSYTGKFANKVHFNFMARGEPLANKIFLENADEILGRLRDLAKKWALTPKFLISTIMPKEMGDLALTDIFKDPSVYPELYYSMYSTEVKFRKRWLPKAIPCNNALRMLRQWQEQTGKIPKIHYAFIDGENDSVDNVLDCCNMVYAYGLTVNWNIVRYNPPEGHDSKEPPEEYIYFLADVIRNFPNVGKVKVIPRVGTDVKASCGTFLK